MPMKPATANRYRMLCCWLCLACAASSWAAGPDWASLLDEAQRTPTETAQQIEPKLAEYVAAGDAANELGAILVLTEAYTVLEEQQRLPSLVQRGLALARQLSDRKSEARLLAQQGNVKMSQGAYDEAGQYYQQALTLAKSNGDELLRASILLDQGRLHLTRSQTSEALARMFEAYHIYEQRGRQLEIGNALGTIADAYSKANDERKAIEYYRRALTTLDPEKHKFDRAVILFNMGHSHDALKEHSQAERAYLESLRLSQQIGDTVGVAFAQYRLGVLASARVQYDVATRYFNIALPEFERTENIAMRFLTLLNLAKVQGNQSDKSSLRTLERARQLIDKLNTPERRIALHETEAELNSHFGLYKEAYEAMRQLREAEKADYQNADRKIASELKARFDGQLKETENALLRSKEQLQKAKLKEEGAQRLSLVLALLSSLIVLSVLAFVLWHQVRQKRRFADLALYDELTGAPNRRHILSYAQQQLVTHHYGADDFTVAVIDLDHFKLINDRFGHDTGDTVLKAFARACQSVLRRGDRLGRMGGEEWLLVMPATHLDEVQAVFERLRQAFQQERIAGMPEGEVPSFSMGAAQSHDHEPLDKLLNRADHAMYAAKAAGRNRLSLA